MTATSKRFWRGAWYGLIGTIAMSVVMMAAWAAGILAEPIYLSIIARMLAIPLGDREITTSAVVFAIPFHLAYGSIWGGLTAIGTMEMTWWKGLVVGIGLWLIMMIFLIPLSTIGFAAIYSPAIWISTLLMHAVYGVTLGALAQRHEPLDAGATSLG